MTDYNDDPLALGRGMTNPLYYLPYDERCNMSEIENTQAPEIDEEALQETKVMKGFKAFTYIADIMQRYPFSLNETKGGRIFVDDVLGTKLRRKIIKGQPQQNYVFETYKTIDNNAVPIASVEISSNGFSPSMLIAAVAAKVSKEGNPKYNSLAVMLLQAASALLQDGEKALASEKQLNPTGDALRKEYFANLHGLTSRANTFSILTDMLQWLIRDDETFNSGFADEMASLQKFRSVEMLESDQFNEDDVQEIHNTTNLLFTAIANFAFHPSMLDIQTMADEIKANIGDAVVMELSDNEQQ